MKNRNRSNNGHTCYTCKVISRRAARTQTKYRRRCRLSNKQTIYRLLHPSPGAEIHGASQPLPSNGRLCISQKSSATPTRPSVRPTHDIRAVTSGLSARWSTDLHWKQLGNFESFWIICRGLYWLIDWFLVDLTFRYQLHVRWQNDEWWILKDLELIGESDFSLHQKFRTVCGANQTYSVEGTWIIFQNRVAGG